MKKNIELKKIELRKIYGYAIKSRMENNFLN